MRAILLTTVLLGLKNEKDQPAKCKSEIGATTNISKSNRAYP
jgi:hypothetical protein